MSEQAQRTGREIRVVESNSVALFDTAKFEHMQRIANVMAMASLIPEHLKSKAQNREQAHNETLSNCFMLVNQASRWNVDPFSIAPETYAMKGKLAYQGKLVAAIVNTRASLKRNLDYTFTGAGDELEVTVIGEFEHEDQPRTVRVKVRDAKTDNKIWKDDPEQKLVYTGAVKWARRYCPEVLLGVLTDDDLERMAAERAIDVTPPPRPVLADFVRSEPKGEVITQSEQTVISNDEGEEDAVSDALIVTTADGDQLAYDDHADFPAAYETEMRRAHKEQGIPGLTGFVETNAPQLERIAETDPDTATALRRLHARVISDAAKSSKSETAQKSMV